MNISRVKYNMTDTCFLVYLVCTQRSRIGQFVAKSSICPQVVRACIGFIIQMFHDIEHARGGRRALPAPASYPGSVADPHQSKH